jgi:hypothetical protein
MRAPIWISALAVGLTGISCVPMHEEFGPTEHVEGQTVEGYKEAIYDLATGDRRLGKVKVWSRGAYSASVNGKSQTVIHVGFTVDNGGDMPISLEVPEVQLESVQTVHGTIKNLPATSVAGNPTIEPRTSRNVEVSFVLPRGAYPTDVRAFRMRWTVSADGETFTEWTPFVEQEPAYAYIPVNGYYYPYSPLPYYDPFFFPSSRLQIVNPYPRLMVVRPTAH